MKLKKYIHFIKKNQGDDFTNDFIKYIDDFSLDLIDSGFDVNIEKSYYNPPLITDDIKCVKITIKRDNKFKIHDIEYFIEVLYDYTFREGCLFDVEFNRNKMTLDILYNLYGDYDFNKLILYVYTEDDYCNSESSIDS